MNSGLLALLISIGVSVWVYLKLQDKTGRGNNRDAAIAALVAFVVGFVVVFTVAKMILS